jgi:hypothetical protein
MPNRHNLWLDTPVLFDGKRLCLISSTKPELQVDMWLTIHSIISLKLLIAKVELRNL